MPLATDRPPPAPIARDDAWRERVERACAAACDAIAPAWPLDRAIAVNPHWGRVDRPVREVAARMAVLAGIRVFPPRDLLRRARAEGRVGRDDLAHALQASPDARAQGWTVERCVDALASDAGPAPLPLLIDLLDAGRDRDDQLPWRHAIAHQVSQTCAAYFDAHQADWQPERRAGLYAFWRDTLQHDHGIGGLMGLPHLGRGTDALPATARDAERWALDRLGLPAAVWADYLEAVLLTVQGWASWCAYLGWQARLAGGHDDHLRELLAVRLAWGAILLEGSDERASAPAFAALRQAWSRAPEALADAARALVVDEVWQAALEAGYQRDLATRLAADAPAPATAVEVQAAFCIDVRSEPFRRALEAVAPGVETIGFAGFFGLPIAYTPLATDARRPQLPGLLAPRVEASDRLVPAGADADPALEAAAGDARRTRLALDERWHAATRWPGAAFSFVEAAGLGYLGKLGAWLAPGTQAPARDDLDGLPARFRALARPRLLGLDPAAQVDLAEGVLRAMGLDRPLAPLVLLVGHGSQSANNAHAAALDCGACGGQTGEVNARSLAHLLNQPTVRAGLRARGLVVPDGTTFVAALHNTTTDDVTAFDLDLLPDDARERWARCQDAFAAAADRVRRERAPRLGLEADAAPAALADRFRRRANDGAETRPEWGLAGNAAFLIAPRRRSRGVALDGRTFLHDYDAAQDPDGRVLELLMTAPMLVTNWINWQYHASVCDPERLGSGNKVLHNVVGGHLGVFEGNGGDLRIGLARQSLHDGERWVHEPLRLTVVIDAPQAAIDTVVAEHAVVRRLVEHRWLHLWRFAADGFERRGPEAWTPVAA